jgi:hypothetical protein
MQLMQTVGDHGVRIVPDVAVTGNAGGNGLLDAMLGLLVREKNDKAA